MVPLRSNYSDKTRDSAILNEHENKIRGSAVVGRPPWFDDFIITNSFFLSEPNKS